MKKAILVAVLITIISIGANAQDFKSAIGIRGGWYNALTYQHFMTRTTAFEGLVAAHGGGFSITGLYEIYHPAFDIKGMKWFYGIGAHAGNYYYDELSIGVDAIIGLEYTFKELPINVSADYKPAWNLTGYTGWWNDYGALSIRYYWN
ncbi:MAG: hypothetical protein WCR42_14075 [bacterium]